MENELKEEEKKNAEQKVILFFIASLTTFYFGDCFSLECLFGDKECMYFIFCDLIKLSAFDSTWNAQNVLLYFAVFIIKTMFSLINKTYWKKVIK